MSSFSGTCLTFLSLVEQPVGFLLSMFVHVLPLVILAALAWLERVAFLSSSDRPVVHSAL